MYCLIEVVTFKSQISNKILCRTENLDWASTGLIRATNKGALIIKVKQQNSAGKNYCWL